MKDRKKDLEDLLAHSIELQKRQQLLPQEKVADSRVIKFNKEHIAFNYCIELSECHHFTWGNSVFCELLWFNWLFYRNLIGYFIEILMPSVSCANVFCRVIN